jgi:hypothetical protein
MNRIVLVALLAAFLPRYAVSAPSVIKPVMAPRAPVFNPHLHGVEHVAVAPKAVRAAIRPAVGTPHVEESTAVHHPWHTRWDAVEWRAAHLQYGDVRGVVVDSAGRPVPHAHVWLQHPNGKSFATRPPKHATNTDAAGRFFMRHVLSADYKLNTFGRGAWAKLGDHAEIQVHQGSAVAVRFTLK